MSKEEIAFIYSIYNSKDIYVNEHELVSELTKNPNLEHRNHLFFYHWYERYYKINIINDNVLKGLNKSNKFESKRNINDEIIDRLTENMNSSRFLGFTIYFEYYFDFFPDLEKFTFEEFKSPKLLNYVISLFPQLFKIDNLSRKTFFRFNEKEGRKISKEYNYFEVYFKKNRIISFFPYQLGKIFTHNPHSLLVKSKREITNLVRQEKGLPKIGEGWISETLLFYTVKNSLPKFKVENHGSPRWLGRQHLDVYIEELNIGIEYQGKQHQEPVDFFGGIEAFNKNIERDERKRKLCEENGLKLFYVFPNTDTTEFIKNLKNHIENLK